MNKKKVYKVCINTLMIITCLFLIYGFFYMQSHIEALEKHPCQLCRDKDYTCIASTEMIAPRNYLLAYEKENQGALELSKNSTYDYWKPLSIHWINGNPHINLSEIPKNVTIQKAKIYIKSRR